MNVLFDKFIFIFIVIFLFLIFSGNVYFYVFIDDYFDDYFDDRGVWNGGIDIGENCRDVGLLYSRIVGC